MSTPFIIDEIIINAITNTRGNKTVTITRDLFHLTDEEKKQNYDILNNNDTTKYPLFSPNVVYDKSHLLSLPRVEVINFFFNRKVFNDTLIRSGAKPIEPNNDKNDDNTRIRRNVEVTLRILLPNSFPTRNDIRLTYNETDAIKLYGIGDAFQDIMSFFSYSYLKIDGTIYTTRSVTWLNDLVHNPKFKNLFKEYIAFNLWCNKNDCTNFKENTYEQNNTDSNTSKKPLATEYKRFESIALKPLRYPVHTTSNNHLQQLLNADSSNNVVELYKMLGYVVDRFINKNDAKKRNTDLHKYLDTGISNINQNRSSGPKYEINLQIDLFEGIVNNSNRGKLFCPTLGYELGDRVTNLWNGTDRSQTSEGPIYPPKNMEELISVTSVDAVDQPLQKHPTRSTSNQNTVSFDDKPEKNKPDTNQNRVSLLPITTSDNSYKLAEIKIPKEVIADIGINHGNKTTYQSLISDLILALQIDGPIENYVEKNNTDLYKTMQKWGKDMVYKHVSTEKQLNTTSALILAELENSITDYIKKPENKDKASAEVKRSLLYKVLIDGMKMIETTKIDNKNMVSGGSRRNNKKHRTFKQKRGYKTRATRKNQ